MFFGLKEIASFFSLKFVVVFGWIRGLNILGVFFTFEVCYRWLDLVVFGLFSFVSYTVFGFF